MCPGYDLCVLDMTCYMLMLQYLQCTLYSISKFLLVTMLGHVCLFLKFKTKACISFVKVLACVHVIQYLAFVKLC